MYVHCFKALNKRHKKRSNKQVTSENVTCFYYWKNGGNHNAEHKNIRNDQSWTN